MPAATRSCSQAHHGVSTAGTKRGHLPPWEACKAFAFSRCLNTISQNLGQRACDLLGQQTNEWIAQQLTLHGGGCPTVHAVQQAIKRCQQADWHPGKSESKHGGAACVFFFFCPSGPEALRPSGGTLNTQARIVKCVTSFEEGKPR